MSTTEAQLPNEHDAHELPVKIMVFTCAELDQDQSAAYEAGAVIENILRCLHHNLIELPCT